MNIILANEYSENINIKLSEVFVDGFGNWLKYFSKDPTILVNAFAHMFNMDVFYVAIVDNCVAGIAACTDGKVKCIKLNKKELKKHLGFIKGSLAHIVLKRELEDHNYPFDLSFSTGSIEFVATSSKFRHMGVASSIIKHILKETSFTKYVLEVADTNTNAVNLYTKLGFIEFFRVKMKYAKQSGINNLLYLEYNKNPSF